MHSFSRASESAKQADTEHLGQVPYSAMKLSVFLKSALLALFAATVNEAEAKLGSRTAGPITSSELGAVIRGRQFRSNRTADRSRSAGIDKLRRQVDDGSCPPLSCFARSPFSHALADFADGFNAASLQLPQSTLTDTCLQVMHYMQRQAIKLLRRVKLRSCFLRRL